jgi:hypothetical protein
MCKQYYTLAYIFPRWVLSLSVVGKGVEVNACSELKFRYVFVGAFSGFGGRVYRIPAPILAGFCKKWSAEHQRGVGVRYNLVKIGPVSSDEKQWWQH